MGIPYYFANVVKNFPNTITTKPLKPCGRLFLDFNSIIHMCTGALMSGAGAQKTPSHDMIFAKITKHVMEQICAHCPPEHMLYIAVDGVAPIAKIQQQRKRRFLTAYRNDAVNKWKTSKGIRVNDWDSNCITPGTAFMRALDEYLKKEFTSAKMPFEVIVSGSDEPGEGEHKMIRYIKNNPGFSSHADVIYGLDADLIMLSMSCTGGELYLMRESSMIEDIAADMASFKYLNIPVLYEAIQQHTKITAVDYIALCFLLGNDFLPCIPFLKIKNGSVQMLLQYYTEVKCAMGDGGNLVVKGNDERHEFNQEFLGSLLEKLSSVEDKAMKKLHDEWVHQKPRRSLQYDINTDLENFPLKPSAHRVSLATSIDPTSLKWRAFYYNDIFGSRESEFIKEVCEKYLRGLKWTLDYYFNGVTSNLWWYEYGYAPTALDLYNTFIGDTKIVESVAEDATMVDISLTPEQQLALVLPPQSHKLLSRPIEDSMAYMYPKSYKIEIYLKQFLWECVPVLPPLKIGFAKANQM